MIGPRWGGPVATRGARVPNNPYENPELAQWLGSFEGVPEWTDPAETAEERDARSDRLDRANQRFAWLGVMLPGVALAAGIAGLSGLGAPLLGSALGFDQSPVSPILLAVVLGLAIRNTIGLPDVYEPGLRLCLKRILRIGVALLGLRLSLSAAGIIGLAALPVVAGCIVAALLLARGIGRQLGAPKRLATLIAVGTAICGNTAIVATGPLIGAEDDETSYAVGTITVFGMMALLTYPFLAHSLFAGDPVLAGLFLGTAIHDTAQVAGAGLMYLQQYGDAIALDTATVTKLVRNLCMLVVIPGVALLHRSETGRTRRLDLREALPLFVLAFVALSALRTLGDLGAEPFGFLSPETWAGWIEVAGSASSLCLAVAMASVGLGTSLSRLRSLGLRPLGMGLAAALGVGVMSFLLVRLVGPILG